MRAPKLLPFCLLATIPAVLQVGCITTPASETGWSFKARHAIPVECGENALIEDGEDGDNQVLKREGRGGYWYTFIDAYGSKLSPQPFKFESPGRNGSKYAAHMSGKLAPSAPDVYPYAGIAFSIANPKGPYDASRYKGISFWAKGPGKVRFEIPDGYTSPDGGWCTDCYNDFNLEIGLTSHWERYTVMFDWMAQRPNWGDRRPAIATDQLYAVEWEYSSPDRTFDVWIDDVSFICGVQGEAS